MCSLVLCCIDHSNFISIWAGFRHRVNLPASNMRFAPSQQHLQRSMQSLQRRAQPACQRTACAQRPRRHIVVSALFDRFQEGQRSIRALSQLAPPEPSTLNEQQQHDAGIPSPALPQRVASAVLGGALEAVTPHLRTLAPPHAVRLLEACTALRLGLPEPWLHELYASWATRDAASPEVWPSTLRFLHLLGDVGVTPPQAFLDTIYYAIGAHCSSGFELQDVVSLLSAAARFKHSHPLDRDLMFSLTTPLVANDAATLRSASPRLVAQLLPSIVQAGHAPGMQLTAAVLDALQPYLDLPAHLTQLQPSAQEAAMKAPQEEAPSYSKEAHLTNDELIHILEAAVGPARGAQLPSPLEPPAAASAIAARLHAALLSLPAPDAVRCLAALAACRLPPCPEPHASHVLSALAPHLPQLQPSQLSVLPVALQRLGITPSHGWAEVYHDALCAQLGRFDDSDALVEALDALTAMDRQMGFRALNQLAQRAAARVRSTKGVLAWSSGAAATALPTLPAAGGESALGEGVTVSELVNTLLVLSYLNHNPGYEPVQAMAGALQPHLLSLSGQQLTNVLWALARLGRPPNQSGWLDAAKAAASCQIRANHLKPYQMAFVFGSLQSLGAALDSGWVDEVLECVRAQLPAMPSHDVALVLHTVSRLQHVTSYAWMADVEAHVSMRLESYQPKEITTVVYAMAKLHHRPPSEWLQAVEDAFLDQLPSFSPDNLVTLVSSLLQLGHSPCTVFLDAVCTSSEAQMPALTSPELVKLLSCLGKLKYQPETEWLARFLSVLHYHLPLLDASAFSSVVQSLAAMEAQVSSDEWWAVFCHTMRPRLGSMAKEDLLAAVSALPGCGLKCPPQQWSQALVERVLDLACSGSLTPDEAERMVVALGALSIPPPPQLLDDFLGSSLPNLPSLPPSRIARLVASFSRGGVLPSRNYLEGLVTAARASVYSFTMLELHELTQGLTQLNSRSPQPVPAVSDFLALVKEWL